MRAISGVGRVLISGRRLRRRVRELAREMEATIQGRDVTVVGVLNGAVVFLADLIREFRMPVRVEFIGVSSYGAGREAGHLEWTRTCPPDLAGREVLLVDDILDTGATLAAVQGAIRAMGVERLWTCVLLEKPARRGPHAVSVEWVGFRIPDRFVVGYGLDDAGWHRQLPCIAMAGGSGAVGRGCSGTE